MLALTTARSGVELPQEIGDLDRKLHGTWSFDPAFFGVARQRSRLEKVAGRAFSDLPAGARALGLNADGVTNLSVPFEALSSRWITALQRSVVEQPLRTITLMVLRKMNFDTAAVLVPLARLLARFPQARRLDLRAAGEVCFGYSRYSETFPRIEELNVRAQRASGTGVRHYFRSIGALGIDAQISNSQFVDLCRGEWKELHALHLPQIASADGSRDDHSYSAGSDCAVFVHSLVQGAPNLRTLLGYFRPGAIRAMVERAHVTVGDIHQTFTYLFKERLHPNLERMFAVYSGAIDEERLIATIRSQAPRLAHLGLRLAGSRDWRIVRLIDR